MSTINWKDTAGNSGFEEPQGAVVKGQPTKHDFATCVVADCHECNKEATDLLDIAGYFRKRGMVQNADLVQSAVMRLNLYSGTKLIARVMGSKGGKKSKRVLTPEQAKAMVEAREKKKREKG